MDNLLAKVKERRLSVLSRGISYVSEDSKISKENSGSTPSNSSVSSMISISKFDSKNKSSCMKLLLLVYWLVEIICFDERALLV